MLENLRHTYRALRTTRRCYSAHSAASVFSDSRTAEFLAAAVSPASIPQLHGLPEITVTGRANVGKSTLLNAVLGRAKLLNVSKRAGRTQSLNFFRVGAQPGKLVVVDAPGYGARGRQEWGDLFNHYLRERKQLRRVFLLFSAKHGLNEVDRAMLRLLNEECQATGGTRYTLQAILTKADTVLDMKDGPSHIRSIQKDIFDTAPTCLPAIVTTASKHPHFGIEEVRQSIADACGLA
ncbi:nucleoside triphosphate hydrolase protein [Wolfiporia cocos MD-104 SS10]|uniref:Nucleoside triphosphate hydrolase protein n=1 Tax=Wolfiporia cocos (strain MD-104) TaxID=742152 RepID=A0A2H3JQQ6_WOLCO|nr:nucleoside triphosphate hydrolase protein [Wolfiporia cocos MD-104 SS10]